MRKLSSFTLIAAFLFSLNASADTQDFLRGRLFQVALEVAPGTETGTPVFASLEEGETWRTEQNLTQGVCYTWFAIGEGSGSDIDLSIYVGETRVAGDTTLDDWPVVQYCATENTAVRAEVLMFRGNGPFIFSTNHLIVGGEDMLEIYLNFIAANYVSNRSGASATVRNNLDTGGEQVFPLQLSGGHCHTIVGSADEHVGDIDFFLENESGQIISSDEAPDKFPVVGACPPADGTFNLRVRMYAGTGEFGFRVYQESME